MSVSLGLWFYGRLNFASWLVVAMETLHFHGPCAASSLLVCCICGLMPEAITV